MDIESFLCHIMSSVTCLTLPYFSTKFNGHDMRVLNFSATFVRNTSHSKKKSARYYHKFTQVFM